MIKKLVVAAIVVALAVGVVRNTWIGSHLRLWAKQAGERARNAVPPEREIERLRMELASLRSQDERVIDKVARQAVQADKLAAQATTLKGELARREKELKAMNAALEAKGELVSYNGSRYERDKVEKQLRLDFAAFEADEEVLKSREAHLAELRKSLALNRRRLGELKLQREQMAADLQRLETTVAEERRHQAEQETGVDDAAYRRIKGDLEAVKERVALMKKKREIRGEASDGPVRAAEKDKAQDERMKARLARPAD